MSRQEVFDKVLDGLMTFEEFDEWCLEERYEAYCEGAAQQAYEMQNH